MKSFHIHITGLVQGVGFRPFVHKLAVKNNLDGWVRNGLDGVHIYCAADPDQIQTFYTSLLNHPPSQSIITGHQIEPLEDLNIEKGFYIQSSNASDDMHMLLTPDIALCDDCKRELNHPSNKRFHYPFITCVNCGPRYSIATAVPYDRCNTTMQPLPQCNSCEQEYTDIQNTRYHSQTNSCNNCSIPMHLYGSDGHIFPADQQQIIGYVTALLSSGKIIAVKGIGGYLLLCDATNANSIQRLRARKHRPSKPFAVLYADIEMLCADLSVSPQEITALKDKAAPIVLCTLKTFPENGICTEQIAPKLQTIGAMLPASPLLQLIADGFGRPLIATSANLSGSPIIFKDSEALEWLKDISDFILTYDREIVAPQDDSVMQFSKRGQKIILRRSRGLAPNYYPSPFNGMKEATLAMGAELKATFAIAHQDLLFISQYLGDQESVESQMAYDHSLQQIFNLLKCRPKKILVDKHPGYHISAKGRVLSDQLRVGFCSIQHHEAHFAAVMAEHQLLQQTEPVLGIIWDGAGYGGDGQIWGGEIFIFDQGEIKRAAHLKYFPQLMGDKMSREPRLSALSLLRDFPLSKQLVQKHFTDQEWTYYQQVLAQREHPLQTSSMGRLIDAVACLLGIDPVSSYEGEAAMQLEALAQQCHVHSYDYYHMPLINGELDWTELISELIHDWSQKEPNEVIAWKFFYSLAKAIVRISNHFFINKIACSGGVFQNALLVDMIIHLLQHKRELYFHQQLSPNDECISMGQLAWHQYFETQEHPFTNSINQTLCV